MIFASKYHAYGNDFIVVASDQVVEAAMPELARSLCNPHFGVGADGCVVLKLDEGPPYRLRIFNRDGSEAGMSGNGARCAAAYLHHRGVTSESRIAFATPSGEKAYRLVDGQVPQWTYRSEMGQPRFEAGAIPFTAEEPSQPVRGVILAVADRRIPVTALSVGNPQCVVFVDRPPEEGEVRLLGSRLAVHERFPEGTNVSFVCRTGERRLTVRIWERGVGPTFSSGTGCCGAAVAAISERRVDSPVTVETPTGSQVVEWSPGNAIVLQGDACFIADLHFQWPPA